MDPLESWDHIYAKLTQYSLGPIRASDLATCLIKLDPDLTKTLELLAVRSWDPENVPTLAQWTMSYRDNILLISACCGQMLEA